MNNIKILFETMPVPKAVSKMAIPTIVGQLIVLIWNDISVHVYIF